MSSSLLVFIIAFLVSFLLDWRGPSYVSLLSSRLTSLPPRSSIIPSRLIFHRVCRGNVQREPVHNAAWRFVIGNILSRLRTYCFAPFAPLSRCMPTHTVHLTRIERDSDRAAFRLISVPVKVCLKLRGFRDFAFASFDRRGHKDVISFQSAILSSRREARRSAETHSGVSFDPKRESAFRQAVNVMAYAQAYTYTYIRTHACISRKRRRDEITDEYRCTACQIQKCNRVACQLDGIHRARFRGCVVVHSVAGRFLDQRTT
jgi:hypothetical protein